VKEQSHKREMGAALRGDFERLRARLGSETALIEPPAPVEPAVAGPEPEPEPSPEASPKPEPAPVAAVDEGRGSWLDRLRGRAS
jgi:hypothetical protein